MEVNNWKKNTKHQSIAIVIARENELNSKLDAKWTGKAEQELNENHSDRDEKLKLLEERIVQDKDIPNARRDNAFLLRFLRAKKFDVDKSFRMIQKYFKMKRESKDLFCVSPFGDMHELLKIPIQQELPHHDLNGSAVYVFRVQNCDPYKWPAEKVFRSNILALENAIRDPHVQIGGLVVLLDMSGVRFAHAKYLSPNLAKRSADVIQDAFPMRFKAFHILHEPFYFDAALALMKPFMTEKIRNRIYTHGSNLKSLHRHIPKEILPMEYGGDQGPFDNSKWRQQLINDEEYFTHLETYKTDLKEMKNITSESKTNGFFNETITQSKSIRENDYKFEK